MVDTICGPLYNFKVQISKLRLSVDIPWSWHFTFLTAKADRGRRCVRLK